MIPEFAAPSEEFKRKNPHIFAPAADPPFAIQQEPAVPTKADLKLEKELQEQIVGFLERNNTVVIRSRTDRKTSTNVGTPDLLFAIRTRAVAMEVKLPGKKPTKEQREMMLRMTGNGWACFIVEAYDEAVEIYKRLVLD